jgi:RNA polymerase II subunit A small phosphatase-like protein
MSPETPKYCLVVDLDETLIHYNEKENFYLVRPGVNQFMKELSIHFELILFTASVKEYADWILDQIDPEKYFKTRLY